MTFIEVKQKVVNKFFDYGLGVVVLGLFLLYLKSENTDLRAELKENKTEIKEVKTQFTTFILNQHLKSIAVQDESNRLMVRLDRYLIQKNN